MVKQLKRVREEQDMSVRDIARAIDVHYSTVSLWENGKRNPKSGSKRALEILLETDAKILFQDIED